MTESEALLLIENDVRILLERALLKKEVFAFGEDGNGQYGKHEYAKKYLISSIETYVLSNDPLKEMTGFVDINLAEYDAEEVGLILSDQNFALSIQGLLQDQAIDRTVLTYDSNPVAHGRYSVCMDINLDLLLDWP